MVDAARLAEEARKYRQTLPADSEDQLRRFLWDVITREDTDYHYIDVVTNPLTWAVVGILTVGILKWLGMIGGLLFALVYASVVLPVQLRNWNVRPEYERRITQAMSSTVRVTP
jgi:hypothetical protein